MGPEGGVGRGGGGAGGLGGGPGRVSGVEVRPRGPRHVRIDHRNQMAAAATAMAGGSARRSPQVYQVICLLSGPAAGTKGTLRSTRLL